MITHRGIFHYLPVALLLSLCFITIENSILLKIFYAQMQILALSWQAWRFRVHIVGQQILDCSGISVDCRLCELCPDLCTFFQQNEELHMLKEWGSSVSTDFIAYTSKPFQFFYHNIFIPFANHSPYCCICCLVCVDFKHQ